MVKYKSDVVFYAPLYGRKPQSRVSVKAVLCHLYKDTNAAREGKATYEEKVTCTTITIQLPLRHRAGCIIA